MTRPSSVQAFYMPYSFRASPNKCIREDVKLSVIKNLSPFSFLFFKKIIA